MKNVHLRFAVLVTGTIFVAMRPLAMAQSVGGSTTGGNGAFGQVVGGNGSNAGLGLRYGFGSTAFGGSSSILSGSGANATGNGSTAIGGSGTFPMGFPGQVGAQATGNGSTAIGGSSVGIFNMGGASTGANASGEGSVAIGGAAAPSAGVFNPTGARAIGDGSVAIGGQSFNQNTAAASALFNLSTALGSGSNASALNSVALGANSFTNVANTVSIGTIGGERRILNLAAGIGGTDAVNVNQLNTAGANILNQANSFTTQTAAQTLSTSVAYTNQVGNQAVAQSAAYTNQQVSQAENLSTQQFQQANKYTDQRYAQSISYTNLKAQQLQNQTTTVASNSYRGVASIAAMALSLRTPSPGKSTVSLGTGYYIGQVSVAATIAHRARDGRFMAVSSVAPSVSGNSGSNVATGGGLSWEF